MKQKIIIILKEKIFYFLVILFASVVGAGFGGIKMGENTLKTAELLRKLCIQDAIKIGFEIGIIIVGILFVIFLICEISKKER